MTHIDHSEIFLTRTGRRAWFVFRHVPGNSVRQSVVSLRCEPHEFQGCVVFKGAPDKPGAYWRVGFTQLMFDPISRAAYRGIERNDGSITERRDVPPALPRGVTRDTQSPINRFGNTPGRHYLVGPDDKLYATQNPLSVMYYEKDTAGTPVWVSQSDAPRTEFDLARPNLLTGKPNYLHSVQTEFSFIVIFIAMDPQGRFHQLQRVYWNVHWNGSFDATGKGDHISFHFKTNDSTTRVVIGPLLNGPPVDARVTNLVDAPYVPRTTTRNLKAIAYPSLAYSPTW